MTPARQEAEEIAAQGYAALIRTYGDHTAEFWGDLNWEIVERWSRTALQRIKKRAWQIVECKHESGSRNDGDGWRCSRCGHPAAILERTKNEVKS